MDRIQGTDGIRRDVLPQSDPSLAGLSPWEAFVGRGVLTEAFLKGYAYAFCHEFLKPDETVVVGWDPRDWDRFYAKAFVQGIGAAGNRPLVAGIIPTPGVPLFMTHAGAAAGIMITASHNPHTQNGVKIFLPPGRKLLPADDVLLTRALKRIDWNALKNVKTKYRGKYASQETRSIFKRFSLLPDNAWVDWHSKPFSDFILVTDAARGSYAPVIYDVLNSFGVKTKVDTDISEGRVNERSGVADLEGLSTLNPVDLEPGNRFGDYAALGELAERAREYHNALKPDRRFLAATVFDADGDRFFLVVYDPFEGDYVVLSGDEVAILQAQFLAARDGGGGGRLFVNTVESDLGVQGAAAALGFTPLLKPVGDKWILNEAWRAAEGRSRAADVPFAIGCEETGHAITFGDLTTKDGRVVPFAAGNGLKSALNTLAAIVRLRRELEPAELFAHLRAPFPRGYKRTNYVYFTRKELLLPGGAAYEEMRRALPAALSRLARGIELRELTFPEEPELLYWAGYGGGRHEIGVFCRNSGTEDKSALYVRAAAPWANAARALEEELYPAFYALMKNDGDARAQAELRCLAGGVKPADPFVVKVMTAFEGVLGPGGPTARGQAVAAELRRRGRL